MGRTVVNEGNGNTAGPKSLSYAPDMANSAIRLTLSTSHKYRNTKYPALRLHKLQHVHALGQRAHIHQ